MRIHVLRPTWHFVHPADICWMLDLTSPRVHLIRSGQYRQIGLDEVTLPRGTDVMAAALAGRRALTHEELGDTLEWAGLWLERAAVATAVARPHSSCGPS